MNRQWRQVITFLFLFFRICFYNNKCFWLRASFSLFLFLLLQGTNAGGPYLYSPQCHPNTGAAAISQSSPQHPQPQTPQTPSSIPDIIFTGKEILPNCRNNYLLIVVNVQFAYL